MSRAIIVAAFCLFATSASAGPNQYLCVVEQSAGLHYNKQTNTWGPQVFGINRKYVLRRLTVDDRDSKKGKWWALFKTHEKANWAFFEFGKDNPMPLAACIDSEYSFACQRIIHYSDFDPETLRFEVAYDGGYVGQGYWEKFAEKDPETFKKLRALGQAPDPDRADDLFVEIGKCSAF
jgi:hypothetical protein